MISTLPGSWPKVEGSFDRCAPIEVMLESIPGLRERFGITRIADLTRLDKIDCPTLCAIVPNSPDTLGVYAGKGLDRNSALVGAVMEAAERQICARWEPARVVEIRARALQRSFDLAAAQFTGSLDDVIPCVEAADVLGGAWVPVPYELVKCPFPGRRQFHVISTNGLAAGANLVEALYHALCELMERHVEAICEARVHLFPYMLRRSAGRPQDVDEADDPCGLDVTYPTGFPRIDRLLQSIRSAGARAVIRYVEEPPYLPYAIATIVTEGSCEYGSGTACSVYPEHALLRALTEAVQTRLVARAGAREDHLRPDDRFSGYGAHTRRPAALPHGRWWFDRPARWARGHASMGTKHGAADLLTDLKAAAAALAGHSIACVTLCSEPLLTCVRVVAPSLSSRAELVLAHSGRRLAEVARL